MSISGSHGRKAHRFFLNLSFILLISLFAALRLHSSHPVRLRKSSAIRSSGCDGLGGPGLSHEARCGHLDSNSQCVPEGYIDYLHLFYCVCGESPVLGYSVLFLWLVLLFYLLGNTAATYFCSSLEGLSRLLRLSPTIAGVTLLSLGNGAPDVFSSVVSFMGGDTSTDLVGLNCVLGGAFFVSSVVVGVISFCAAPRHITIDRSCFVRDVCFLLFVLLVLLAILVSGEISLWTSLAFSSLYLAYVLLVSITHFCWKERERIPRPESDPLLPTRAELAAPLLGSNGELKHTTSLTRLSSLLLCFLEQPLCLPRRLTIPDVSKERWSKPFAVVSVTLSPVLLAALWDSKREGFGSGESLAISLSGVALGVVLGAAAAVKTRAARPPARFQLPWLAGGFLMSVTWTYILAEELVSLMVSLGVILNVSPSALGLTVLAWGNSLGDLIANVAVAAKDGGPVGAQVAISGCYGGPVFNTLVGLGASFVVSAWAAHPSPRVIPRDPALFQTIAFLMAGLLWALAVLPRRGMRLDRVLAAGLVAIYLCFLSVSLCQSLGFIS